MSARAVRTSVSRARAPAKGKGRKRAPSSGFALPDGVRRFGLWLFGGVVIALLLAVAWVMAVPQMIGWSAGEAIGRAGFAVERVEIKGAHRVPRLQIYNVAWDQPSLAMPLVDLEVTRERLLRFGWIKDARVSRRLPDTLVVDIVERRPSAVWQHQGRLALIDADGVVLEQVKVDAMPDLPLVIGPAANTHAGQLTALTAAAPHLKPRIAGATWIGGRRWDIRFETGETLALPEGDEAAKKALARFARMDQGQQLLGRGFVRFDMRIADQITVRVSKVPGGEVPDIAPPPSPPGQAAVDQTKTI